MQDIICFFQEIKAIARGHFVLSSGRHAETYLVHDFIYSSPRLTHDLAFEMTSKFLEEGGRLPIDTVLGPAPGGAILAHRVGEHINDFAYRQSKKRARTIYAEKDSGGFVLRRTFERSIRGRRILLVDDVITTGDTFSKLIQLCRAKECRKIVGLVCIWNRGADAVDNMPVISLVNKEIPSWSPEECKTSGPCGRNVPISADFGHGNR